MDARYGLSLLAVIVVALVVGLAAAQSQSKQAVVPSPTAVATSVLPPQPGVVEIIARPPANVTPAGCGGQTSQAVYCPETVTVKVNQPVIWGNLDMVTHTIVADNGSFTSGVLTSQAGRTIQQVASDQIYRHMFTKAGRYTYSDYLHPDMHGVVVVTK